MGTRCAPTFANIFMASIEDKFLSERQRRGAIEPFLWLKFIDEILVVWPGLGERFPEFLDKLNVFHPSLKYTFEKSSTDLSFLDITIHKGTRFREGGVGSVSTLEKNTQ